MKRRDRALTSFLGVRFGAAELYGVIDKITEIEDCIAAGQHRATDKDEQVLLFVKMKQGKLNEKLCQTIRESTKAALSPRHVPAHILQVKDIPYTLNGKKIESVVRATVSDKPTKVTGTAANPECLEEYKRFVHLPSGAQNPRL